MPFCPQCNHANHHSVTYCASCGFRFLPNVNYPTTQTINKQADKKGVVIALVALGAVIALCGGALILGAIVDQRTPKEISNSNPVKIATPTPESVSQNKQPLISSKQHLEFAKQALNDNYKPNKDIEKATFGNITLAREHLSEIHFEDAEYAEAQKLYKEIERREAIIDQLAKQTARIVTAKQMENKMLSQGFDMTFKVSGKGNTILTIEYILMTRPVVYKIENETDLLETLRQAGFKKVVLTDGYDKRWWFTWE